MQTLDDLVIYRQTGLCYMVYSKKKQTNMFLVAYMFVAYFANVHYGNPSLCLYLKQFHCLGFSEEFSHIVINGNFLTRSLFDYFHATFFRTK